MFKLHFTMTTSACFEHRADPRGNGDLHQKMLTEHMQGTTIRGLNVLRSAEGKVFAARGPRAKAGSPMICKSVKVVSSPT